MIGLMARSEVQPAFFIHGMVTDPTVAELPAVEPAIRGEFGFGILDLLAAELVC